MIGFKALAAGIAVAAGCVAIADAETLTIATVNNDDMIIMQKLSSKWEQQTGNKINWVILEENVLRQKVTTDIATKGGQYDVITIGAYETPIWGKKGWLTSLDDFKDYDYDDLLAPVKAGLSVDDKLYAVPFYAESSFTMYRKDLFEKAGLTMPEHPTYEQIKQFADKLTDKANGVYGICLRGKPGWGENMAFLGTLVNTYGGRWFDMKWEPQLTSQPWETAINYYIGIMKADGPPGASANGFNENLGPFLGRQVRDVDRRDFGCRTRFEPQVEFRSPTKLASLSHRRLRSQMAQPGPGLGRWPSPAPPTRRRLPRTLSAGRPRRTTSSWSAKRKDGSAPPGTRRSTYDNPDYQKAAPFAPIVLNAIMVADPNHATKDPVPYTGVQFVTIPEFQGIGTTVGQDISAALAGSTTVTEALEKSQGSTVSVMTKAGYIK